MRTFPMPPPQGYAETKTFGYAGDYGYYLVPSSSSYGQGADASDYYYVSYDGVAGKDVWIYGAWGVTPIPAASGGADACGHAHTSYGVWARFEYRRWFGFPFWFVSLDQQTMNPLSSFSPQFGWGNSALHLDLRGTPYITQLVLGVLSYTHGWGSCTLPPGETFPACHEPSWAIAYTLP
jgi:hypothetical protein